MALHGRYRLDPRSCAHCGKRLGASMIDDGLYRFHAECYQERQPLGLLI